MLAFSTLAHNSSLSGRHRALWFFDENCCDKLADIQTTLRPTPHARRSPGQLRPDMELGHWVAGSQNVTQFHVCLRPKVEVTAPM